MSTTVVESSATNAQKSGRYIVFRIIAVLVAAIFIIVFGVWQTILAPWITFPDSGEHGWDRTPELHRLADAASALLMIAVAVAALTLAIRPVNRSALTLWTIGTLALIGMGSLVSSLMQGQDPVGGIIFTVVWLAILVAPLIVWGPERHALFRGGAANRGEVNNGDAPSRPLKAAMLVLAVAGFALAIGVVGWRITGGLFENPLEDDVVGVAMLGLALAGGALLCVTGRPGWRALAIIVAGMTVYAVIAGLSIAMS